jgi:hypothetical protein
VAAIVVAAVLMVVLGRLALRRTPADHEAG